MIRAYSATGEVTVLDAPVLEIASTDGKPAVLVVCDPSGRVEVLTPKDERFGRICKTLGLEPAEIIESII